MTPSIASIERNIRLYRWSRFLRNLLFWQAVWFLYFQNVLSGAEAILLYAVFDVSVTLLEVPSGYMSDRLGRRKTLIASAVCALSGTLLLVLGDNFLSFACAQILLGAGGAFASGTDEALLYESLTAAGREDEIEAQEITAWRYSYTALAMSALTGGAMALVSPVLPFAIGAIAMVGLVYVTAQFVEPPRTKTDTAGPDRLHLSGLGASFRNPVLLWFFGLSVAIYAFSHLPFVFGQPFILTALDAAGLASSAPMVSGAVTASMMAISVGVSLIALRLRGALGLAAFGLQIAISGVMALSDSVVVVAFLLLRMVPDALSRPFILGRVQPLLSDDNRATWLSINSFVGRLVFAAALAMGAVSATDAGTLPYADIQKILSVAVVVGVTALIALGLAARRVAVATPKT